MLGMSNARERVRLVARVLNWVPSLRFLFTVSTYTFFCMARSFVSFRRVRYTQMSLDNKQAYADLHGYDVIVATSADVDHTRPAAWSKLLVLEKHLGDYDYLM